MRLIILSLLVLVVLAPLCAQQKSIKISGKITDKETGEPIGFCLVGIAGSSLGSVSKNDGSFLIEDLEPRPYKLVISHVGYQEKVISILPRTDVLGFNIELLPKVIEMEEVTVSAGSKRLYRKKERELERFRRMIFGANYKRKLISILNEDRIANKVMMGKSDVPSQSMLLNIENNYLGYDLEYINFQYIMSKKLNWFFGETRYQEKEGSPEEIKQWQANRLDAYKGSLRHFLKSLIENKLEEEGFVASITNMIPNSFRPSSFVKKTSNLKVIYQEKDRGNVLVQYDRVGNYFSISFDEAIEIYYVDDDKAIDQSILVLEKEKVRVYASGELVDPLEVRIFGEYALRGIYEMLPFNYEPNKE